MSFLDKIKSDIKDPRNQRGSRYQVLVDIHSLYELVEAFERCDSGLKALTSTGVDLEEMLHYAITALYHRDNDSDKTLMIIMQTLLPLMRERQSNVTKSSLLYKNTAKKNYIK